MFMTKMKKDTIKCPLCGKPTKKEWQLRVGADHKSMGKVTWVCENCYLKAENERNTQE